MPFRRSLAIVLCLVGSLSLLTICCDRPPDRESEYRGAASRIEGRWRLLREDQTPFVSHPPCLETLRIDLDSPSTSTAFVTFCGGGPSELSGRVTVEVADEPSDPYATGRGCRMNWEPGSTGPPREMHVRWSEAVYEQVSAFYAEDVLTVEFSGPWLADRPNAFGALVIYARDTADAAPAYNPR